MSNRILKFNLPIQGGGLIKTKNRPNILSVGYQDTPVIWVEAEIGDEEETFFYVATTGEYIMSNDFKYIGTATTGEYYVVHVYKLIDAIDNYKYTPLSEIVMK